MMNKTMTTKTTVLIIFLRHRHFSPLRSSSGCLRILRHRFVPSIFPSITCVRRRFLSNTWPIQLAFLRFNVFTMSLYSLTLCNTSFFILISPTVLQHHIFCLCVCIQIKIRQKVYITVKYFNWHNWIQIENHGHLILAFTCECCTSTDNVNNAG
jgi:hypothetical protein